MTEPNELQLNFDVELAEAELEAAATPDEKLAVLKQYMCHDDAVCCLERILDPSLPIGCVVLHDAPDEAIAR
jgi:hypothetical protein